MQLDLTKMVVEVLILAKNPNQLKTAGTFLTQRGWRVSVFGSVTKAVERITESPPDLVLVSFNHGNPSVPRLPELIGGKVDILYVAFVEGTDAASANMLSSVKFPHKIFGQPGGPNLQRGIRRILAQHLQLDWADSAEASEEGTLFGGIALGEAKNRKTLKQWLFGKSTTENMARAVDSALNRICDSSGATVASLQKVSRVGVFPVESELAPGYLVVAADASTDGGMLNACENAFHGAFRSGGVPGRVNPGFWVELPKVDFVPWAEDKSSFNLKRAHQGSEMGVAFFQGPRMPEIRATSDKEMFAISLESLPVELPLSFQAYLHLKQNKRYYLYLRQGRSLLSKQKERLQQRQITEVFVKASELENVREFFASSYLRSTME